ncbi:unnamed protein product [Symbiodinium sp. CCMP2592]|nr:unnamed protein product [Symbiodinium sp. CCMP2592]
MLDGLSDEEPAGKASATAAIPALRWRMKKPAACGLDPDPSAADISSAEDIAHVKICSDPSTCARCLYLRNREHWSDVAALTSDGQPMGTWLMPMLGKHGKWGLGCFVCRKKGLVSAWAEGRVQTLSLGNVRRHGQSLQHCEASEEGGYDNLASGKTRKLAPPTETFAKVLQHRKEGKALRSGLDQMGAWKITKIQYCLAEAVREEARAQLRRSHCIALKMDSREGMLLVRFTACDADLSVAKGVLGHKRIQERETSSALVRSVRDMVRHFCLVRGCLDEGLAAHICDKVQIICADKASNEQVAGRMARSDTNPLFKNAHVVNHDSAHAMQRVLKRPWQAIEPIQSVIDDWITGPDSVTQMIEHSTVLSSVYHTYCQKLESCPIHSKRIKDLRAAKHRFASLQKPLGRCVLTWDAVMSTLLWAAANRTGAERQRCVACLSTLTEERLILMAMCADVADENTRALRYVDSEDWDPAEWPKELGMLMDRLHFLINKGGVLDQGYTACMLDLLREQRGFLVDGAAVTLGGDGRVTPAILVSCCDVFKAYVSLAVQTMQQEFPLHDLLSSLAIFDIRPRRNSGAGMDDLVWTERRKANLARLAQACNVSPDSLLSQYIDLEPVARFHIASAEGTSFDAWRTALLRCRQGRRELKARHPVDAIWPALILYGAFSGLSTSGVEQGFALLDRFQPAERRHMLESTCEDEAYLLLQGDIPEKSCCERAQKIWMESFAAPRQSSNKRFDKGVPRAPDPHSEKSFIKKRRLQVDEGASAVDPEDVLQAAANRTFQSQAVLDEESWQRGQKYTNKLMAYLDGALLQSEVDDALVEAAVALKTHQEHLDAGRKRREADIVKRLRPQHIDVQKATYYVEDNADHYVVADPGSSGDDVLLAAVLQGGILCSVDYAKSKGKSGVAFCFDAAVAVKRQFYVSEAFRAEKPALAAVIFGAVERRIAKWTRIRNLGDFVDRTLANRRQQRKYQCVGLFADSEAAQVEGEANMFVHQSFLKFVSRPAVAMTGARC